jgi:protoheme IX farnesyltransferase
LELNAMTSPAPSLVATRRRPLLATALHRARDYAALTRPRVLAGVVLTAPAALVLGGARWPETRLALPVLLGTALLGGGCGALNAWWERDRDACMLRTQGRPLPTGRLAPREALGFGIAISALGLALLYAAGGWLPVWIGLATLAHYLLVYTLWLKPRSAWSTVAGGVAGAAAPLVADAAADGRIGIWGLVLFAIVFLWQPPHVWAIALYRKAEYAAAGFPMLPARAGNRATRRWMLAFAIALVPVTLLPWFGGALGPGYATVAAAGGACFMVSIVAAQRADRDAADRRVFVVSLGYLAALFLAMLAELAASR